ncbi:MAG: 2'-5' RNA ligase family protein [Chloroflexi bacterium]|nr:2'-5' RNA ligase family protein [Chloroflexota bacterium]
MDSPDRETKERHDDIWRDFLGHREIYVSTGRIAVPPAVSAMLVFQVPVADAAVRASLSTLAAGLQGAGCLFVFPPDYWHATIVPPTLLTKGRPSPPNICGEEFIERALAKAKEAVRGYPAFQVTVAGVNAFRDVVVAVPYDGGHFAELNQRLRSAIPELPARYLDGHEPIPHISLAQYAKRGGLDELIAALGELRDRELGTFTVSGIEMLVLPIEVGRPGTPQRWPIPFL